MYDTYKDIFNKRGASYHRAMTLYPLARREEFALVTGMCALRDGDVVCDVPSGGAYLRDFIDVDARIISVETSEAFARGGTERGDEVILSPLNDIALPDRAADCVISLAAMHHVEDRPTVIRELRRLAKPSGRVCIADVARGSHVAGFLDEFCDRYITMGHVGDYMAEHTRGEFEAAGLRVVDDRVVDYHWHFADAGEMSEFCMLLFGLDKATPDIVHDGIRDYLGYTLSNGCRMNWQLRGILCEPA